jgi:hypothetical protein
MANPTLPIVAGTANTVIHGGSSPPAAADLGIASDVAGCVITDMKTAFPMTQDTYFDQYMQPLADVLFNFGFEISFNAEIHTRNTAAAADDIGIPTAIIGSLADRLLVELLTKSDCRGWHPDPGGPSGASWVAGTKFIVKDGAGTFERQKLRKDAITLQFRRYAAS